MPSILAVIRVFAAVGVTLRWKFWLAEPNALPDHGGEFERERPLAEIAGEPGGTGRSMFPTHSVSIATASAGSSRGLRRVGHPRVALGLSNLAQLLQAENRLREAGPLMRRALAIAEASYAAVHPDVAIGLNNLAQLLQATNRLAEAEPLHRRALAIDEASYGNEQPNMARDRNNLAQLFQATNRLGEAEPLIRRYLDTLLQFTRQTGHEHPHLRSAVTSYVSLLSARRLQPPAVLEKLASLGPEPTASLLEQIDDSAQ